MLFLIHVLPADSAEWSLCHHANNDWFYAILCGGATYIISELFRGFCVDRWVLDEWKNMEVIGLWSMYHSWLYDSSIM